MPTYLTCLTVTGYRQEYHPASPFIDFIVSLSQINYSVCQAVLDAGFLDMLLCMYVCNFACNIPLYHGIVGVHGKSKMMEACTDALLQLCEYPGAFTIVSAHPLCAIWPKNRPLILRLGHREQNRHLTWRKLGPLVVTRRLASLPDFLELQIPENDLPDYLLTEACTDLVDFAR
jgi:hypothetical protein